MSVAPVTQQCSHAKLIDRFTLNSFHMPFTYQDMQCNNAIMHKCKRNKKTQSQIAFLTTQDGYDFIDFHACASFKIMIENTC